MLSWVIDLLFECRCLVVMVACAMRVAVPFSTYDLQEPAALSCLLKERQSATFSGDDGRYHGMLVLVRFCCAS
jgi:hypothetical protein